MLVLALALSAHAADGVALFDDPPASTEPAPATAPAPAPATAPKTKKNKMEVGARGRYLFLPGGILDISYNSHADDDYPDRPSVSAYAVGLEYDLDAGSANGLFYLEYIGSLTNAGYYDDKETPDDFEDGSWIDASNVGMIAVGADYMGEFPATPWLSFMVGGGLGVGITTGEIDQWVPNDDIHTVTDPDCGIQEPAYQRVDDGCANDGALTVPPVLPLVDINVALKFNINDRATIRLDGGLHDLIYGGGSVAIRF